MCKVSVIVPVYNVEKYLEKCLDSLVTQSLKDIEIIVVNDGSPDNCQEIIDKYAQKYPDLIKAFIKENGGLSDARNYGIAKAKGEYISLVDSDDYIAADMLLKMYNKATMDGLDIVVCDTINVYDDGKEELIKSNLHFSDDDVKNYIIGPTTGCIKLYKSYLLKKHQFKKGILYEDLELTPSLALRTDKIGFIEEGLYYYLQRSSSIMNQVSFNEKLLDIFTVLDKNRELLGKKFPAEVEYLYITHLLRSATLRFLNYKNTDIYLEKIVNTMKDCYPQWQNNIYLKKSSFKLKVICKMAYYKHYGLLKMIKRLTHK